jgi:hypothetical protein
MKVIRFLDLSKYTDKDKFEYIENWIYKDLADEDATNCRVALSVELEDGENEQYPLEDILDKYYLHVSEFIKGKSPVYHYELAGELDDIRRAIEIVGKRVYNETYTKDGKEYVKLQIIEGG